MATVDIRPFEPGDAPGVVRLAERLQWPSLTDPDVVARVCTAPGATAYSAVADGELVGWAQALSDGVLQAHLSFVGVLPDHRGRGIGRLLVTATFQGTGALRMDLVTDGAEPFYGSFAHHRMTGFRIYPGADDPVVGDGS